MLDLISTISPSLANLSFLSVLNLENNSFRGGIPYGLGHLPRLRVIDIQNNQLNGSIPASLFQHRRVQVISLAFNELGGEMWKGPWYVPKLRVLDLTNNGLTGMIPPPIGNATKMMNFSLSGNRVSGNIPKEIGKSKDVEKVLEIKTHQLVSYHKIQQATNNFDDESNLIGEGSSGSVYKGILSSGTVVAIKVLDLENEQVCKRFDTECKVMRNVRHKNLVPVITTCSSDYIRGFVMPIMPNGSLENWLYKEDRHLNLHQRVTVMLDAAMAVEYLHHAISKSMAYTETLGTLGYIAPEYGSEGIVSASGDVYSYGIMLMDVWTKRWPTDEDICNENLDLRKWITQSFSGSMMDVVDANLFSEEEQITCKSEMCIASMIELALDCTKKMPESRVTMKEVVKRLNKIKNTFLAYVLLGVMYCLYFRVLHFGEEGHCSEEVVIYHLFIGADLTYVICVHVNPHKLDGLTGSTISKRQRIVALDLPNLQLQGQISPSLANLSFLRELNLGNNSFHGGIPCGLGHLPHLQVIDIQNNQLNGSIPTSLFQHRRVQVISLAFNKLGGEMWKGPWYVPELIVFDLRNNSLIGMIPPSVGNATKLLNFSLHGNRVCGNIPKEIGNLSQLASLSLADNQLTGTIPNNLGNLHELQILLLHTNQLANEPRQHAHINGLIPTSIGNVSGLTTLIIEGNNLTGSIPPEIGMLPSRLGDLLNLQSLDLSNNSFFGQIPLSLANLISLEFLDLSLNALSEGVIPSGGVFGNSTLQSFLENKGVCGVHILEIPACAITYPGKQSKLKEVVLKIATPVVISSLMIFLLVSIWIMKRQKKGKSEDVEKVPEIRTHQLVSYHEIQLATNIFDESNLIGVGGSGSVYKGRLSGGTLVAIKVLDLQSEEVCKRFDTECEVMRNVRHRNLVPVITTCSSDYIRAFVLQYMSNGSLENWLYREESNLNLLQRVAIMLDVAVAIEYLHHGHNTPIVHCDLKPANVLLDEDMVAHVGDFFLS
ncbi:hypothetical protein KY284_019748 [Solanum tuberosum]|nr:hypothetical protein KY284_019748 [Solanum tuberosum]